MIIDHSEGYQYKEVIGSMTFKDYADYKHGILLEEKMSEENEKMLSI